MLNRQNPLFHRLFHKSSQEIRSIFVSPVRLKTQTVSIATRLRQETVSQLKARGLSALLKVQFGHTSSQFPGDIKSSFGLSHPSGASPGTHPVAAKSSSLVCLLFPVWLERSGQMLQAKNMEQRQACTEIYAQVSNRVLSKICFQRSVGL